MSPVFKPGSLDSRMRGNDAPLRRGVGGLGGCEVDSHVRANDDSGH